MRTRCRPLIILVSPWLATRTTQSALIHFESSLFVIDGAVIPVNRMCKSVWTMTLDLLTVDSNIVWTSTVARPVRSRLTGSDIHTALRRPTNSGELRFCRGWYRRNDQTRTALAARRKQCQAWSHDSAWVDLMWVYFVGVARSIEVDGPHESCKSSLRQVMCQMRLER